MCNSKQSRGSLDHSNPERTRDPMHAAVSPSRSRKVALALAAESKRMRACECARAVQTIRRRDPGVTRLQALVGIGCGGLCIIVHVLTRPLGRYVEDRSNRVGILRYACLSPEAFLQGISIGVLEIYTWVLFSIDGCGFPIPSQLILSTTTQQPHFSIDTHAHTSTYIHCKPIPTSTSDQLQNHLIPSRLNHLISPPQPNSTQINLKSTTMPSSDWEQHFLDKFIAGSSRPASPASPSSSPLSSQPRTSSPARRNMTPSYNTLQQPHSTNLGRTSSPARLPANITSAPR